MMAGIIEINVMKYKDLVKAIKEIIKTLKRGTKLRQSVLI
jgi:hypothetical protein